MIWLFSDLSGGYLTYASTDTVKFTGEDKKEKNNYDDPPNVYARTTPAE